MVLVALSASASLGAAEPPAAAQPKPPAELVRPALKAPAGPANTREPVDKTGTPAASKPANCGTHWTQWMEDPDTNANPCPKDCVRGERQLVRTHEQGNKMLYAARYQCYRMAAVPQPKLGPEAGATVHPRDAFRPKVVTTEPMQLTGTRRALFVPKALTTQPMQLTGTRRPPFTPRTIATEPIQITGTRPPRLPVQSNRPAKLP